MILSRTPLILVTALAFGCAASPKPAATPKPTPAAAAAAAAAAPAALATVEGEALTEPMLQSTMEQKKIDRDAALEELIDRTLTLHKARALGLATKDAPVDDAAWATLEYALAKKLALALPTGDVALVVDHAWVKDAQQKADRAANKKAMDKLRALLLAGTRIPDGWKQLGLPGALWHIGDHEEYGYGVLPREARDLAAGKISTVIPGDGGLHLFQVHARKELPPGPDEVRGILRAQLRDGARIEKP